MPLSPHPYARSRGPLSLYVHVPFCVRKCPYCAFSSWVPAPGEIEAYLEGLEREARWWADRLGRGRLLDTLFVGGGTPTLLSPERLGRLFDILDGEFFRPDFCETSLEANPGTLTEAHLRVLRERRVNRISLGVQSLDEEELRFLGRIHGAEEARDSARAILRAGFRLNCDLMFALPGQSLRSWASTLSGVLEWEPDHVSVYQLTLEPGTPLAAADPPLPEGYPFYRYAQWRLRRAGLPQYEIANFGRIPCRHNLAYWERRDVLGLGPGAWGFLGGIRYADSPDPADYRDRLRRGRPPVVRVERLSDAAAGREAAVLATRTVAGLRPLRHARRYGWSSADRALRVLRDFGPDLVESVGEGVRLTPRGMRVGDRIWTELI